MIITLCGSVRLGREVWDKVAEDLTLQGHLVFTVNVWNQHDRLHSLEGLKDKHMLDLVHKVKIAKSDLVYVLWKDGYLGESTKSEIEHAKDRNIPLHFIDVANIPTSSLTETE